MKYAHIIDNKLQGWYDTEIHTEIPTPNIEVTDEVWQEAINISANFYDEATKTFIVKDFRTNEEVEQDRINAINSKVNQIIENKYPLYKQNNIIRIARPYTQQDLTDMSLWIDSKRDICHNAVEQGLQPYEVVWGE